MWLKVFSSNRESAEYQLLRPREPFLSQAPGCQLVIPRDHPCTCPTGKDLCWGGGEFPKLRNWQVTKLEFQVTALVFPEETTFPELRKQDRHSSLSPFLSHPTSPPPPPFYF